MAEDKKPEDKPKPVGVLGFSHPDPFAEIVWFLLAVMVIIYLINGALGILNSGSSSLFGFGIPGIGKAIPLSDAPTLLGVKVQTSKNAKVFAEPGVNQIGTKPSGFKATIIDGPIIKNGVKYWHVKFDDGTDGWVDEEDLEYLKKEKRPLSQVQNSEGGKVSVSKTSTPVYSEPGQNQIAIKRVNAEGDIIGGPETKDGIKYWKVRFDDETEGWVAESDLDYLEIKSVPLSSMPSLIGGKVLSTKDGTILYDSPAGTKITSVKKGALGKIVEGPIIKNGVKYWHVKFDDGKEGWVAEDDLDYVEGSNLITQTTILFKKIWILTMFVSVVLSILLSWGIYYLFKKVSGLRQEEVKKIYLEKDDSVVVGNPHWDKIQKNIDSMNESDWRLAILEADIMLDGLLDNLRLPGVTMADKLKAVEKSDFTTIDNAWEAHKIRNQVAHEGATFSINHDEARRVIDLYKSIFEEFRII